MVTGVVERKSLRFFPVRVNPKLSIKNVTGTNFFIKSKPNETLMSVEPSVENTENSIEINTKLIEVKTKNKNDGGDSSLVQIMDKLSD